MYVVIGSDKVYFSFFLFVRRPYLNTISINGCSSLNRYIQIDISRITNNLFFNKFGGYGLSIIYLILDHLMENQYCMIDNKTQYISILKIIVFMEFAFYQIINNLT
jgi:hypothetical protein